jgi:hypothetical protein
MICGMRTQITEKARQILSSNEKSVLTFTTMEFGEKEGDENIYHLDGKKKYVITTNSCIISIRNSVKGGHTQVAITPNSNTKVEERGFETKFIRVFNKGLM